MAADAAPSAAAALDGGIDGLRRAYGRGLSPAAVVEEVLARIEAADDPAIWIDVEPADELRRRAEELAVSSGPEDLPLWGAPFGLKDNIDVAGRVTTAGLPGLAHRAERTATVVDRLLAAGALYIGKTNLDQLATGLVGTRSPYGTPRNPLDPSLVPGGSSSGSAVAVARRQVSFALGTDTAGSGRVPAAMCGIVGVKGVPGSRPLDGVVPASPTIDCVSTFARSLGDALLVESILGACPWLVSSGPLVTAVAAGAEGAGKAVEAAGHRIVDADLAPFHAVGDLLYGGPWLAERTSTLQPLLLAHPDGTDPVVATVIAEGTRYSGIDVFEAQRRLAQARAELESFWRDCDVLVVPTVTFLPTIQDVAADPFGVNVALGRNTTFANLLGLAAICVPATTGPGGVTVLGPKGHLGAVATIAASITGDELPAATTAPGDRALLAVVGAHLRGQPLHGDLVSRGAELVARTRTSPTYRLHRLPGGPPLRPGLERVAAGGAAIAVEVVSIDDAGLGSLTRSVPAPLGIGSVELSDGQWVRGFVCEPIGLSGAVDITDHGGWFAYLRSMER